jgi:hypothetical protein
MLNSTLQNELPGWGKEKKRGQATGHEACRTSGPTSLEIALEVASWQRF